MHPNCEAVNAILYAAGVPGRVRMLDEAVTTARAAAQHLGCPVGAIANSLIFETFIVASVGTREHPEETGAGTPLLIMTSGAHQVDMTAVGKQLGVQLRRASPASSANTPANRLEASRRSAIQSPSAPSSTARLPNLRNCGPLAASHTLSFRSPIPNSSRSLTLRRPTSAEDQPDLVS
jgi:hypothetical protein